MSGASLRLAPGLSLPLETVTRRLAILGMSGSGKSNVAVVLAEQMYREGLPWVAIDPKGDWWGVRSSRDGKGAGLPVPIFGGLHGDIPLEYTAGKLIAETIVQQRLTCVLDVSEMETRQQLFRFLIDFGEAILRLNRDPLHLFFEEADDYMPQKLAEKGLAPTCLGVLQRVVKKGRFRGLGSTQITQRNALLNKSTLYMAEALIVLRATGKGDRDAVKGWVEHNDANKEIVESLASLGDGEGWLSSPAWLRKTERVQFDRRTTFDSGATPVMARGKRAAPATLADVDLPSLRAKMAETIERAKENDPDELRQRLHSALDSLAKVEAHRQPSEDEIRDSYINGYAAGEQEGIARGRSEAMRDLRAVIETHTVAMTDVVIALQEQTNKLGTEWVKLVEVLRGDALPETKPHMTNVEDVSRRFAVGPRTRLPKKPTTVMHTQPTPKPAKPRAGSLSPAMSRVLNAARFAAERLGLVPVSRLQLALLAGYTENGHFNNMLGEMRTSGLLDYPQPGTIELTNDGVKSTEADGARFGTRRELHAYWISKVSPAKSKLLRVAIEIYPKAIDRADLASATGYTENGHFNNMLGEFRSMGLLTYPQPGQVRAADELFPARMPR